MMKIEIETNNMKLPVVYVDGKKIDDIQDVQYRWVTDSKSFGKKIVRVRYVDKQDDFKIKELGIAHGVYSNEYGEE